MWLESQRKAAQSGKMIRVHDIGALSGEVLIFGGPYSNLQALRALDRIAAGFPPGNVICTGDVVAYCADPLACLALIRSRGWAVVAGNCERQLAASAQDCGCGFETGSLCEVLSRDWYAHASARIGAADRAWMAALPDAISFTHGGRRHLVLHGGATDVAAYLWPTSPVAAFEAEVAALPRPADVVIAGHSGIGFERRVAGVSWINAGVIGMPPHDGGRDTRFGILSERGFRLERLVYDAEAAAAAMRGAGLTGGYDRALLTGFWPSEQILPPDLRRAPDPRAAAI